MRGEAGAIGRPLPRKEDLRLLTGAGRFSDDFNMPGQAYAAMVRSPYPHARILRVPLEQARAMAGVLGVYGGSDCAADRLGPIPHNPLPSTREDMKLTGPGGGRIFEGPHWLLPTDKVRHVGEAVAMRSEEHTSELQSHHDLVCRLLLEKKKKYKQKKRQRTRKPITRRT